MSFTLNDTYPRASSPASSVSSSGLYIPVHKRRSSSLTRTDDAMSTSSGSWSSPSSRPSSRAESHNEFDFAELSETRHAHVDTYPGVYSRDRLLALAKSPLAVMPKEAKDALRERLPEIVMSRKHRKAMEYRALMQQRTQEQQQQQQQQRAQVQRLGAPSHHPQTQTQQQHNTHQRYHYAPQKQHTQVVKTQPQPQPQTPASHVLPQPSRPLGHAWWKTAKPAVENMNWRKSASISVA
ncbi:hypothetical protein AX15_006154 [Amanita polypyramis BW_CC]|nr:hypothetical protein AX15_006154 [Amanita polypyramis BW_CC]